MIQHGRNCSRQFCKKLSIALLTDQLSFNCNVLSHDGIHLLLQRSQCFIESVHTSKRRVQGQGISPVCDFASRQANKEQTAFSTSTKNEFPLVPTSFPLVPDTYQRISHSLITRADGTNGREMLRSRERNNTTRTS